MKNKTLTFLLLAVMVTPQLAFASWWNPTTWFQAQVQSESDNKAKLDKIFKTPTPVPASSTTTKTLDEIFGNNTPKSVEKAVIKTVTIDNPEQAKEIIDLTKKLAEASTTIDSLNQKIADMTHRYVGAIVDLKNSCEDNYRKMSAMCISDMQSLTNQAQSNQYYSGVNTSALNQLINNQNTQYQAQQQSSINEICNSTSRQYDTGTDQYCTSLGR